MLCASLATNPGYNVSSEHTKLRRGGTHISKLSEESGRTTTITALRAQDRRVGVDSLHHMQIQRGLEVPLGCIYDWCSPYQLYTSRDREEQPTQHPLANLYDV